MTEESEMQSGIGISGLNPVQVSTFEKGTTPRAVVVLVGDIGQKEQDLDVTAAAYHARRCATVCVSRTIFANSRGSIDEYAEKIVEQASNLLSGYEDPIPLLFHVFGNGGGYCLKRVEELLKEEIQPKPESTLTEALISEKKEQLQLLAQRLKKGAIVYDSGPAYPNLMSGLMELRAVIQHPFLFGVLCMAAIVYYFLDRFILGAAQRYWVHMERHRMTLREAYVYSISDSIADHQRLDKLIESRKKENPEMSILTRKFHYSTHCQHMLVHKKAYCLLLDEMLKKVEDEGAAK